jgi:peroxiredoxin
MYSNAATCAAQVLLFYPADWSFVCPSEIISFNDACASPPTQLARHLASRAYSDPRCFTGMLSGA